MWRMESKSRVKACQCFQMSILLSNASTAVGQAYTMLPSESLRFPNKIKFSMTLTFIRKGFGNLRIICISEMLVNLQRSQGSSYFKDVSMLWKAAGRYCTADLTLSPSDLTVCIMMCRMTLYHQHSKARLIACMIQPVFRPPKMVSLCWALHVVLNGYGWDINKLLEDLTLGSYRKRKNTATLTETETSTSYIELLFV